MAYSDEWITLHEAAQLLGVHPATVRHWSDEGRLPVYRTSGGHRRYKRDEVELWARSARPAGKRMFAKPEPAPAAPVEVVEAVEPAEPAAAAPGGKHKG